MRWLIDFGKSSIGAKIIMGLTGSALVAFVIQHMIGNLLVFAGQDSLNSYAKGLKDLGGFLWVARAGLIGAFALHVAAGLRLAKLNRDARPVGYQFRASIQTKLPARYMALSGLLLLAFIGYHLAHFTFGLTNPAEFAQIENGRHDVYNMVVAGFSHPVVSGTYIVAMVLLGMHLSHGVSSVFQSLGANSPRYNPIIHLAGPALAVVLVLGNISMPIAVMAGLIPAAGV